MTTPDEIRKTINLIEENLITQPNVIVLDVSPYQLTTLMKEFRAQEKAYGEAGDKAQVMFYDPSEKEEFKKFLQSKSIGFNEIGN